MAEESSSGDGIGSYRGGRQSGDDGEEMNEQQMRQLVSQIAKANGTATLVTQSMYDSTMARINSKFGATSKAEKKVLEMTLTYYFGVHGTSPDTQWSSYEYPIKFQGKSLPPNDIIREIGLHRLKKFMGRSSTMAIEMVKSSPDFQGALSERAARANLAAGQEYMAIDYVGKDGSLSRAEAHDRVNSRESLLAYRARNANNISDMRAGGQQAAATTTDARSVNNASSRPVLSFDS